MQFPNKEKLFFLLRHFSHFCWDILVICLTVVSKLAITMFISLYFQTFWPKWLNFFSHFKNILVSMIEKKQKKSSSKCVDFIKTICEWCQWLNTIWHWYTWAFFLLHLWAKLVSSIFTSTEHQLKWKNEFHHGIEVFGNSRERLHEAKCLVYSLEIYTSGWTNVMFCGSTPSKQARRQDLTAGGPKTRMRATFLNYSTGCMQQSKGQTWNGVAGHHCPPPW